MVRTWAGAAVVALCVCVCVCGVWGVGGPVAYHRKAEKHVRCLVCTAVVQHAFQMAEGLHDAHKTYVEPESKFMDIIDESCVAESGASSWARLLELAPDPDRPGALTLVQHDAPGQCRKGCRTLLKACQHVVDEVLTDDFGYILWANPTQALRAIQPTITKYQCADVCPDPPLPHALAIDFEPWVAEDPAIAALRDAVGTDADIVLPGDYDQALAESFD